MPLRRLTVPFALTLFGATLGAAGCSTSTADGGGGGGGGPKAGTEHYHFDFTTAPGKETHWCEYRRLPDGGGKGVGITGYTWSWTNMHHWALYKTTSDLPSDVKLDEPFDCFAPGGMKYAAPASLVLGGGEKGEQKFPEGTGLTFAPNEIVIFQAHTVNATAADLPVSLDVDVATQPADEIPNPLGLIQFYDPYIVVPPHAAAQARMRCNIPADMTIVYGTTHQHTRGTSVSVFLDEPGARATDPFLVSTDWEHPTVADTFAVKTGTHIRTVCDYMGDENEVTQGQNKDSSEMCMFIGYYYPVLPDAQRGLFENCVQDSFPSGVGDEYGVGTKNCADSLACIQACAPGDAPNPVDGRIDVGTCWQKCLVDSCPSASAPLNDLGYCVQTQCAAECSGSGDCPSCVVSKCTDAYVACQSDACAAPTP